MADPPETRRVAGPPHVPATRPVAGHPRPPETRQRSGQAGVPETRVAERSGAPPTRLVGTPPGSGYGPHAVGAMPPAAGPPRLPRVLAERFEVVAGTQPVRGGEAWVWRVTERHGSRKRELALKVYHSGFRPDPEVLVRRTRMKSPHVLRLEDSGMAEELLWELARWAPGGTLHDLIRQHPDGVPAPMVRAIVEQLAVALREIHAASVVHRDVKPANIVILRNGDASRIEVAIVDFGAASYLDRAIAFRPNLPLTREYAAPEITAADAVTTKSDWWSLGMVVAEMAIGQHPLHGLTADNLTFQISQGVVPIPDEGEATPEIRLLCRGLLVHRVKSRWDGSAVELWLKDKPQAVPDERGPGAPTRAAFVFDGTSYYERAPLAEALAARENWGKAVRDLFGAGGGRWPELRDWMVQFHDEGAADSPDRLAQRLEKESLPPDGALLLVLRYLDPGLRASYRGYEVSARRLPEIASHAAAGEPVAVKLVDDFWALRLLPHLDSAPDGAGLSDINARWRASLVAWETARARLSGRVPAALRSSADRLLQDRWNGTPLRAWLLRMAADAGMDETLRGLLAAARRDIRSNSNGARLDWFEELVAAVATPEASLLAFALSSLAVAQSERVRAERETQRASQLERVRLWTRRERFRDLNRPVALGWAAASVGMVAIGWIALLLFSSGVRFASASEVNQAWIFMTIALILQSGVELWLAAVIGGPYYPDYSLLLGAARASGRTGRIFRHRGTAGFLVVTAICAALLGATITVPFLLPLIFLPAHAGWAYTRYRRWQADYARRKEHVLGTASTMAAEAEPGSRDREVTGGRR